MNPDDYTTKIAAHSEAVDHHIDTAYDLLHNQPASSRTTNLAELHNDAAEAHVKARDAWRNSALGGRSAGVAPYFATVAWQLSFKAHTATGDTGSPKPRHLSIR